MVRPGAIRQGLLGLLLLHDRGLSGGRDGLREPPVLHDEGYLSQGWCDPGHEGRLLWRERRLRLWVQRLGIVVLMGTRMCVLVKRGGG